MNRKNRQEVNNTYQTQIDAIRSIDDYSLQKLESIILQKKELLTISKDIQETEKLLAEIDALEWLQAQIAVLLWETATKQLLEIRYYCCSIWGKKLKLKFDRTSDEYPMVCWDCMIISVNSQNRL